MRRSAQYRSNSNILPPGIPVKMLITSSLRLIYRVHPSSIEYHQAIRVNVYEYCMHLESNIIESLSTE